MTKGEITQLSRSIEGLKSIKVNCNLTHYQFDSLVYALAVLERVEEENIRNVILKNTQDHFINGTLIKTKELAHSLFTSLTGEVGK